MKKAYITILLFIVGISAYNQTITTTIGTITTCPDNISIPINVTNFNDVASISLSLEFAGSDLTYLGYTPHPDLNNGTLLINGTTDKVLISWYSALYPLNIGSSTLLELEFDYLSNDPYLKWDTATSGNCQYSNSNLNTIPAHFIDGNVFSALTAPDILFPQNNSQDIPISSVFTWTESLCSPLYRLQIAKDSLFTDIVVAATGLSDTSYNINNLDYNTTYFLRVNASITLQTSAWSDTIRFVTKGPPGIFELNNTDDNLELELYPNPVTNNASIKFNTPEQCSVYIFIYDYTGRKVYNYEPDDIMTQGNHNIRLNFSSHLSGFYILELFARSRNNIYSQKTKIIFE